MRVKILVGFAKGLEGVVTRSQKIANREGWIVRVTYPDNFLWKGESLAGHTEELFYYTRELEFVDSE